jgi:hypothetical protein
MARTQSINITKPCHELWQQMVPVDGGRHCQSCCKTVIDFSAMTDKEIISYLGRQTNVCGRFDDHQLNRLNRQLQDSKPSYSFFRKIAIAATVLMAIPFVKANAQKKHKTEQAPVKFKHRDTLAITPQHLTGADIKIEPGLPFIKETNLNYVSPGLTGRLGGVQVTGVFIKPAIHRFYTSIYDMLRDL